MWSVARRFAQVRDAGQGPRRLRFPMPDAVVLPPYLRRPARMLSKIDIRLSDRFGLKAAGTLLAATGIYGVIAGSHIEPMFGGLTAALGLKVTAVRITGQTETAELDVLDRLALAEHGSIVTFNADAARQRIEEIPWVQTATVRKVYPATVEVEIEEREAFALWQREGRVSVVDDEGVVLTDTVSGRYTGLPLVVGAGARSQAAEIVALIDEFPSLTPMIRAATLVANRRWNLTLRNGITILLPEENAMNALIQLVALDQGEGLLSRDIVAVDLRLPDRMVVRLDADGMRAVQAVVRRRAGLDTRIGAAA